MTHLGGLHTILFADSGELLSPDELLRVTFRCHKAIVEVGPAEQEASVKDSRVDNLGSLFTKFLEKPFGKVIVCVRGNGAGEHCPVQLNVVTDEVDCCDILRPDAD